MWTVAGGPDFTGKPRPAVILQDDAFTALESVTLCLLSTNRAEARVYRPPVQPDEANGLRLPSCLLVDKISTVPKSKLGARVGMLADDEVLRLNRAVVIFLGLADSSRGR